MARPNKIILVAATAAANSDPLLMNWRQPNFKVSLGFKTSGSTTGFTVQHCFDDPHETAAASWTWFDHPELAAMTANEDGNIAFPVTAVRLKCDANGTDTGTLFVMQAGG